MKKRKMVYLVSGLILLMLCGCSNSSSSSNTKGSTEPKQTSNPSVTPSITPSVEPTISPSIEPTAPPVELKNIEITSKSLTKDGFWSTAISGTSAFPAGLNKTPQLSWTAVEGATCYAIYMYDTSASNWMHWKSINITSTSIELGAKLEKSKYFGPYPPSGTHEYQVIVYALKEPVEKCPGTMDSPAIDIRTNEQNLDEINGSTGNIIGKGILSGKVTIGLKVE